MNSTKFAILISILVVALYVTILTIDEPPRSGALEDYLNTTSPELQAKNDSLREVNRAKRAEIRRQSIRKSQEIEQRETAAEINP